MSTREIIRVIGKKLVESGLVVIYYEKLSHPAKKKLLAKQNKGITKTVLNQNIVSSFIILQVMASLLF